MASYFDRLRAAGGYSNVMPRHKPDPRDPNQEFVDEQWSPPPMSQSELAASGGGQFGSVGGGPETYISPTGPVMGAQPTQPGVGPQSTVLDTVRGIGRADPRGQQFAAGDASFRRNLAGIEGNANAMEARAGQIDNGAFINALRFKFAGTPLAGAFDYLAGLHDQASNQQRSAQNEPKAPPVSVPAALQPAIQRYQRQD